MGELAQTAGVLNIEVTCTKDTGPNPKIALFKLVSLYKTPRPGSECPQGRGHIVLPVPYQVDSFQLALLVVTDAIPTPTFTSTTETRGPTTAAHPTIRPTSDSGVHGE